MTLNVMRNLLHKFIVVLGFMGLITIMSGASAKDDSPQPIQTIYVPSPALVPNIINSEENHQNTHSVFFTSEKNESAPLLKKKL